MSPSLNMVWSSITIARTAMSCLRPHEQGPCRKAHTEIAQS